MQLSATNISLIQDDVNNDGMVFIGDAGRYKQTRLKEEGIRLAVK
jgi:hypothetical protein